MQFKFEWDPDLGKTSWHLGFALCLGLLVSTSAAAVEVITREDIEEEVVVTEQLIPLVENAIFLIDTSSSMNEPYKDTGTPKLELMIREFAERNEWIPELGYKFGLYVYTPWREIYPVQTYEREGVAEALAGLPKEGEGPTMLTRGLAELDDVLDGLTGRTAVYVFTDGGYTDKRRPISVASTLVREHDVCFYLISTARDERNRGMTERVAGLNECSRVIPFDYFLERPEYLTGALFEVRATESVTTRTASKIVGLEVSPMRFAFDSVELDETTRNELDAVAGFMSDKDETYVVIHGYTDSTGPEEYNLNLSRRRCESAAAYLTETHGIAPDRIVLYWHGQKNPVADNDTREGRAKNRRVEMAVGGL